MHRARFFKKAKDKKLHCQACQRYCLLSNNQLGFCQTRLNKEGILYSLIYGVVNGFQADPIEKKPLYHFYPASQVLSFGSFGCNYRCKQCLNFYCSWGQPAADILKNLRLKSDKKEKKDFVSPEKIVRLAVDQGYPGIAFTYNEPSIWPEYVYDVAKLAKEKGLYTVFVTNGSWTKESLDKLAPVIDSCNIDIKGYFPQTYQKMAAFFGQVLEVTELVVKKYKIFTELTTLVIPTINDSDKELEKIAGWIVNKLGRQIPWHLSRFDPGLAPDKQFQQLPATPVKTLEKAYQIGKKAGLDFVYLWAPPKNRQEELFAVSNTVCPSCRKLVVKRDGWQLKELSLKKNKDKVSCQFCGQELNFKI